MNLGKPQHNLVALWERAGGRHPDTQEQQRGTTLPRSIERRRSSQGGDSIPSR